MHSEMDRLGTDHIHISHRNQRYHIAKQYAQVNGLKEYVFGELMADICRATVGQDSYLFYDQYVAKASEVGRPFAWHQDSGYLDVPHTPYVTVWAAVDDMTAENGTVSLLPYSEVGIRSRVEHIRSEDIPCSACHDPHGVPQVDAMASASDHTHLINFDLSVVQPSPSNGELWFEDLGTFHGRCNLLCHGENHNPETY